MISVIRKILVSIVTAAGLLAIVHLSTRLDESSTGYSDAQLRLQARRILQTKLQTSKALQPQLASMNDRFRDTLTLDELKERNPYADIDGMDVSLGRLLIKGVRDFKRETYRSPQYNAEFGYDLVHYSVDQMDGSKSIVMAYLEKGEPVVTVVIGGGEKSEYFLFRSGTLSEKSNMPFGQAAALIERKINESVPFLSVAR